MTMNPKTILIVISILLAACSYAGWPTGSAFGPNVPMKRYAGEYAAFAQYWKNWPEHESQESGDTAMAAGANGYLDGGTVNVP